MFSFAQRAEIKLQYETQGFVHLRAVIPPDVLAHARSAFDRAAERATASTDPAAGRAALRPPFFDIPHILDQDDVFVDLVDLPAIFPLLVDIVGDDIQLNHTSARLFYPGPTFTSPWHSDISHVLGISHAHSLNFLVKAHFFLEDLAPDQGCLAFIPGSHRYPAGHPKPEISAIDESAAVVKTVPRAGDVVIFNTHVLHMATDNASDKVRKSIIYAYSHFWVKHYDSAVPANLDRLAQSHQRKQLFGVESDGVPYFNRRLGIDAPRPFYSTLAATTGALAKRVLRKAMASVIG